MIVNHTPADVERMKREGYDILYRMHICRLITSQAMEMHKLFCNKERYDVSRMKEIEGYQKLLNKVFDYIFKYYIFISIWLKH